MKKGSPRPLGDYGKCPYSDFVVNPHSQPLWIGNIL